jgi:hypothetical protein
MTHLNQQSQRSIDIVQIYQRQSASPPTLDCACVHVYLFLWNEKFFHEMVILYNADEN